MSQNPPLSSLTVRRAGQQLRALAAALLVLAPASLTADEPPGLNVGDELEWLKSLALEGRISIVGGDAPVPRLFDETFPDGRTWFARIADDLAAAGDWSLVDGAIAVCLAEADHLKRLAEQHAGTSEEGRFNTIRKIYLEAAGKLLATYRRQADTTFEQHAGALLGLPGLPDWMLPLSGAGGIELREIAGGGRLNVDTGAFSGRFSGLLQVPGLATTLAVPNLSFDSRGNVDLTAYGQTRFPANDPGAIMLAIPPRNPLLVHLADDGDFRVAGGVDLVLPGGNTLQASFDIDDPKYAFGLAFSGVVTFDLADEILLVRPTLQFDPADPPSLAVLDGMAQFFGSLGKGVESFLAGSPELPSPEDFDIGAPPDFAPPVTSIPFDVFDAWLVAVGNEHVRPALNGPVERTAELLREALAGLRTHLVQARAGVEPGLAQLQHLSRVVEMNGKIGTALKDGATRAALGEDGEHLLDEARTLADEALQVAAEHLEAVPPDADFKTGLAAVRLAIRAAAMVAALGGEGDPWAVFGTVLAKIDQWNAAMLGREGFHPDGTVSDPARVAALSPVDLRTLALATLEVERYRFALGAASDPFAPTTRRILRLEFERVHHAYQAAVAAGNDEARIRYAAKLPDYTALALAGFLDASDEEREGMLCAYFDTWEALKEAGGGTSKDYEAAQKRLQAAQEAAEAERATAMRRKEELFGSAGGTPDLADPLDFSLYQYSFWQRLGFGIRALRDAGILHAVLEGRLKADLASILGFYHQALGEKYADATLVQRNLEDAYGALTEMVDMIALAEDLLGEGPLLGELRQTWQALHLRWVGVAEARKAHWLLSAYVRQLAGAAGRYGDGIGPALDEAFTLAGAEATAGVGRVVDGLADVFAAIDRETLRFKLPGNLEVRRLFGDIAFNRITGEWNLGFGGLLVFPDMNAQFEIISATLASNGDFAMSLRTNGPVPFGLEEAMTLDVQTAFSLTGNILTPSLDSARASGQLLQEVEGQSPHSYAVEIAYEFLDPGHRFEVRADTGGGPRELFTPEVMIFAGGFGFDLETDAAGAPTQGGAEVAANLGLLLRPAANPDPAQRTPADYFLHFSGGVRLDFSTGDRTVKVTLKPGGTLTLPPDMFSGPGDTEPAIRLLSPACVQLDFDNPAFFSWGDRQGGPVRIAFDNIGFRIDGLPAGSGLSSVNSTPDPAEVPDPANQIPGFQAGVSAVLLLSGNHFPVVERISAVMIFPLPGAKAGDPNRLVSVGIDGTNWRIDGLPDAASISLRSDIHLVDCNDFDLFLLAGSGLGMQKVQAGGGPRVRLDLTGSIRGEISRALLAEDDGDGGEFKFGGGATGSFSWDFVDPPQFSLSALEFSGAMKLGGDGGLALVGIDANGIPDPAATASISLAGLGNLFSLSPATPFEIKLNGAIGAADIVFFGLKDARFVFDGIAEAPPAPNTEPQFLVSAIGFRTGSNAMNLLGLEQLPVRLTAGSIAFAEDALALPFPDRLALPHLIFTVTGEVDLSLWAGDDAPRLLGAVEDLQVRFAQGFDGLPTFNVDSLALQLENLTVGDMAGLSGGIVAGNLNDPANLFFGGRLGGGYNGVGIEALAALRFGDHPGLIGLCLKVNAGPVGIPLDGGSLGGIMLTGASGGVSFGSEFANPCEFLERLGLDADTGEPTAAPTRALQRSEGPALRGISELEVLPWDRIAEFNEQNRLWKQWRAWLVEPKTSEAPPVGRAPRNDDRLPCPTGNCPPATVGLLSQRHPSLGQQPSADNYHGRFANDIIYKFTSLDRKTVDDILAAAGIDLQRTPEQVADEFTGAVCDLIDSLIPRPGPDVPFAEELNAAIGEALARIGQEMRDIVAEALRSAAGGSLREALYEAAYGGIRSLDTTILLNGTFTYTPVAAALSATGGAVASTTGSAGIAGSLNLVGIPVGTAEFYFSVTDEDGLPNPSLCGLMRAALGPLQLGRMDMKYECPACVTGVLDAMLAFVTTMSGELAASADPILRQFIADALGVPVAGVTGPLPAFFGPAGSLDQQQQVAVMAAMVNLPDLVRFLEAHPGVAARFSVPAMRALGEASIDLLLDIYDAFNPRFTFCGEVAPELFGFSLTGGNTLVAAQLYADKTSLAGNVTFSPTYLMGNLPFMLMSGGTVNSVLPALDEATMGIAMAAPAFDRAAYQRMTSQPLVYAGEQLESFLANATLTFGYKLSPLGLRLASGQGRVILPTIAHHPGNPQRPGGPFVVPAVPSRDQVLKAALDAKLLAAASWQGKGSELAELFPAQSDERAGATGKELARDYFPHGGFLGAAQLQLPRTLTDFPPLAEFGKLFDPATPFDARLAAAGAIINDYLTAFDEVGQMTTYVPFPSPPAAFWTGARDPQEFLRQVSSGDLASLIGTDPFHSSGGQFFLRGDMQLDILGMPLAQGTLVADPATGIFRFASSVPEASWLHDFVQGDIEVEIRSPEYIAAIDPDQLPAGETAASLRPAARLQAAAARLRSEPTQAALDNFIARITDTFPKASLQATLGLTIPPELAGFIKLNSSAGFHAFSPRFEPAYATPGYTGEIPFPDPDPADPGPYTLARRNGGFVAFGNFDFGFNLTDPNPANRLVVNIPQAALAVTGGTANPFPNLATRLMVGELAIPGLPSFSRGLLSLNSNPAPGESLLRVEGVLQPFGIRIPGETKDLLTLRGLNGNDLGGTLQVTRDSATLEIQPAQALLPFLGPKVAIAVVGNPLPEPPAPGNPPPPPPPPGSYLPFSFSSTPGQAWSATVWLSDPANPSLGPTFRISDPWAPTDSSCSVEFKLNVPVCGSISGTGLQHFELQLRIPNGFNATFFPEMTTRTSVHVGGDGHATLAIDSNGRFYVDFGPLDNIGLPGVLTAGGRLEFGYNPEGPASRLVVEPAGTITFGSADLNQTIVRQFTVTNIGNAAAQVGLRVSGPADYSLSTGGFTLAPGATRTVDITFHPSRTGTRSATLTVESNSVTGVLTRALTGTGVSMPRYVQSRDHIGFPLTVVEGVSKGSVTIGNAGSAQMPILIVSSSNPAVFSVSPSGGFSLGPGGERLLVVSFKPEQQQNYDATLEISSPQAGTHYVTLAGRGGEPQWTTVLDSSLTGSTATLRDIKVLADGVGWAVGDDGAFYETRDSGASWTPRRIAGATLNDIHIQNDIGTGLIAAYHFEEPPGALRYRDDGPRGHHGSTPSAANQPRGGHDYGKIGAGLYFDNPAGSASNETSDYVELGAFDLAPSFAISLWVNPVDTRDGQFFVAKHTASGANQFLFGFFTGGYWVSTPMGTLTAGTKQTGWQHLVVNGSHDADKNATTITIYRQGVELGSKTFAGSLGGFGGGKPWVLGQEWDDQRVSDVFQGSLDELMFFNRTLSAAGLSALARGEGGHKILVAGRYGTLLQSDTRGRAWHQVFDQNVNGWRARFGTLRDYDWNGVTTSAADGRTVVAGASRVPVVITRTPIVMAEGLYDPNPAIPNDDQFDEVALYRNPSEVLPSGEIANAVICQPNGRHFAFTNLGRVFTDANGLGVTWPRHGSLDLPGGLHSAVAYQPFAFGTPTPSAYLAVGDQGAIVHSSQNGAPVQVNHGLTTESFKAIATTGLLPVFDDAPPFHVVGTNGVYLTGLGASPSDWTLVANGLIGTNYAVDVRASRDTVGHTVWVAGEQNRIQRFHSGLRQFNSPTLTFYPGQLDFGMLPLGQSRTLPLRLQNRGKSSFSIASLTVSGAGFSLAQGAVSSLAPGDSATLQLRYRPATASELDLGQLAIAVSGQTFGVPLEGRCQDSEWVPVVLQTAGTAFDGSVIDLAYAGEEVRESVVFAITASPDRDRVFRSIDSGWSWTEINPPTSGSQFYRFEGLDALKSSLERSYVVALAGALHDNNGLADGRILLSFDGGDHWNNRTPADGVILPFADVAIYPDGSNTDVIVCSSRGSGADVWQTVNARPTSTTWTRKATTPGSSFIGGRVAIFPVLNTTPLENGATVAASSGNLVFARGFNNEWSGSPSQGLPALTSAAVTGMHFGFSIDTFFRLNHAWLIGHGGQFWRWAPLAPTDVSPFQSNTRWLPASNQQVFGTTNLEAVAGFDNHPVAYIVGGSRIFRTGDHGHGWDFDYDAGPGAALKSVALQTSRTRAWAGGSLAGRAVVWRQQAPSTAARPVLSANDIEFFPPVKAGQSSPQLGIAFQNIGTAPLPIHHVRLESDDPIARFRIVGTPPSSIAAGATVQLPVVFDALPDPVDLEALRPVAFLRFEDEWGAASFADHSGNRRRTIAPADPAQRPAIEQDAEGGRRDRCLRFDGADDSASIPHHSSLNGVNALGVSAWFRVNSFHRTWQALVTKGDSAWRLARYGDTDQIAFDSNHAIGMHVMAGTSNVNDGQWHHVAAVFDGQTKQLYIDGRLEASAEFASPINTNSYPVVIGENAQATGRYWNGWIDDVAVFDHALTPGEIRMLANKSPACGEHRARLVIHSGSESGERVVELRAEVLETSDLLVIDSVPSGRPVMIDGIERTTPFAAAIRCTAGNNTEWVEGSLHKVSAAEQFTVSDSNNNLLEFRLAGWNAGTGTTRTIAALPGTPDLKATYVMAAVAAAAQAPPQQAPRAPANGPSFDFDSALAGTPAGPFLRLSGAHLTVGGLAADAFEVKGDLFVSLTKLHAALHTDALSIPNSTAGTRFLELGASDWLLDLENAMLRLNASPPSVKVLGKHELAPEGQFSFLMDTAQPHSFEVSFKLRDDFRPIPDFLEFKKGSVRATVQLDPNPLQPPAFVYRFEGGLRLLRLPPGFNSAWAIDNTRVFEVDTATFTRSLSSIIDQPGPVTLVDYGPWFMSGDLILSRVAGGDIVLTANIPNFQFHGSQVARLDGSISTGSELTLSGSASTVAMNLVSGGRFRLEKTSGGNATFKTTIRALPQPLLRLEVPALTLKCTATGFPDTGLALPGISFDTSGTFDTGRLALPSFTFDHVAISKPSGGQLANNYIQLKRDSAGKITFDTRAQLKFLPIDGCTPDQFSLTIDGTKVDASYRGYFCVLPEPIALGYTPGQTCPFTGSAFGFTIRFGHPSCTGVSQGDICILGACP